MSPINSYPESKFRVPAYIKYANTNADAGDPINLFFADAINIDFRVQGIIPNGDYTPQTIGGYKYIIGDQNDVPNLGDIDFTPETNDIIVYNDISSGPRWELLFRASNPAFGASGGAFAYVIEDQSFYGFDGDEWGPIAAGSSGPKGDTGESVVYGVRYTLISSDSDPAAGEIAIANEISTGFRILRISSQSSLLGANYDFFDTLFPNGTSGTNTTKCNVFLYNKTKERTYGFRITASINGIQDGAGGAPDFYEINSLAGDFDYFKLLIDESTALEGSDDWGSDENSWQADDEIYLYAIADGVDGAIGAPGITGTGITLAASSPDNGELIIQYINSDGSLGDTVATGIVSGDAGVTGDPGEVGLYMYFTGDNEDASWDNDTTSYDEDSLAAATPNGTIRWGNDVDLTSTLGSGVVQDTIAVSVSTAASTPTLTPVSFNLTNSEFIEGEWYNRPGTLYFYSFEDDYEIKLRSFLTYQKVKGHFSSGQAVTLLTGIGITFGGSSGVGIADGEYGFVLPVPTGVQGIGITFGEIVDNTLYLDYIDADGNTFGRFASVQGVSGAEGQMNPFNIRYGTTADGTSYEEGYIRVGTRDGTTPESLYVSATAENGINVLSYIAQADEIQVDSGYITVFDRTNSANFGIFRFDDVEKDASNNGVIFHFIGSESGHIAGPLTQIIGTPDTGLPTGDNTSLLAISIDGKRGFSGTITGYTFGIEYFIGADPPHKRSNNDPLEIGDKWYCTTVGLEFTFLGASGDTDSVVAYGVSYGGASDPIAWVQTNNARQGRRGPQGIAGIGTVGATGATGLNFRGVWAGGSSLYKERDVVFYTYSLLRQTGSSGINWESGFNNLGLPGTTSAAFVATRDIGSNTQNAPGNLPFSEGSGDGGWRPLFTGYSGVQGIQGVTGSRGTGITATSYDQSQDKLTFHHQNYDGQTPSTGFDTFVTGIRGPIGPTGPIGGNTNQFMYRAGETTVSSTNNLKMVNGYPTLVSYVENLTESGTFNINDDGDNTMTLFVNFNASSSIYINLEDVSTGKTIISRLAFVNIPDYGAQTIIFDGVGASDAEIDLGTDGDMSSVKYLYGNGADEFSNVYFSVQAEIDTVNANIIRLPRNEEAGILTARRHGADLYITYVLYDKVK